MLHRKSLCRLLAVLLLVGAARDACAQAEKVAIAPLENRAGLTLDELDILTSAVRAALVSGDASIEVVPIGLAPGEFCDAPCLALYAKNTGARYLVTGAVVLFGGEYTVKLEAQDRISGSVVAGAATPVMATLPALLPLVAEATGRIRAALQPKPTPAAVAPSPPPAAPQAAGWPSDDRSGVTGTLEVTSDPPGAKVWLSSPGEEGSSLGVTPVERKLDRGKYELDLTLEGYAPVFGKAATVLAGETTSVHVRLRKGSPLLVGGIVLTFGGALVTLTGAMLLSFGGKTADGQPSPQLSAGIPVTIIGVAMMAGGIAMWAVHAARKKGASGRRGGVALLPAPGGVAMAYALRF